MNKSISSLVLLCLLCVISYKMFLILFMTLFHWLWYLVSFFSSHPWKKSSTSDYWFIPTVALEPGESHSLQTCSAPRCLSSEITNIINELLWLKSFSEETLALLNIGFDFGNNNNCNLNLSDTSLAVFPSFTKNNIFEVFFLRMLHGAV